MSIPSKVMSPNTKDLIAGDQDLGFLEGQARKILDNTLRKYAQSQKIIGISYSIIGIGYIMVFLLYLHHSYLPIFPPIYFLGIGLLFLIMGFLSLVAFNKNFMYMLNKGYANVRDWKKFLESKEGAAKSADPHGRLEVLMRMVASMDSWLYTEKNAVFTRAIVPVLVLQQFIMVFSYIPRSGLTNDIIFVISAALMLGVIVALLLIIFFIEYMYAQKQKYWRPRLMTYWARLDSYWGRL